MCCGGPGGLRREERAPAPELDITFVDGLDEAVTRAREAAGHHKARHGRAASEHGEARPTSSG